MSDPRAAALLAAICADDGDAQRLVYADHLLEHGDPRGELIVVQCALAQQASPELAARAAALIAAHGARWRDELGLREEDGAFERGFVEHVALPAVRAAATIERLARSPLRTLTVRVDLSRNDDEIAHIARALSRALPRTLRVYMVDYSSGWQMPAHDDTVTLEALDAGRPGKGLTVEIAEPAAPHHIADIMAAMLRHHADIAALELVLWPRDRVELDDVFAILRGVGPRPALRRFAIRFDDFSGREWLRWIAQLRIDTLAALYPGLEELSLSVAELACAPGATLSFPSLRSLELNWLGGAASGPSNPDAVPTPRRGVGLAPLRTASLPQLTRLAIDFQYDWYIAWSPDDCAAVAAASLPSLRTLVLRHCLDGDALCAALVNAPYLRQVEDLDLIGTEITSHGAQSFLAALRRFANLKRLRLRRPFDLEDNWWAALRRSFPIVDEHGAPYEDADED